VFARCYLIAIVASATAFTACFSERVPDATQISCRGDAECPPGFLCRSVLGRCVSRDQMDETPPGIDGETIVYPSVARRDTTVAVAFKVTEVLASDPVVHLLGHEMSLQEEKTDRVGLTYRYEYRATGTEPEDSVAITIDLLDRSGNLAPSLSGGNIHFDFTAPEVVVIAPVRPEVATVRTEITATISFNETLGGDPKVWVTALSGGTLDETWVLLPRDSTEGYTFAYSPTGGEETPSPPTIRGCGTG
jgi:hypothetical protein